MASPATGVPFGRYLLGKRLASGGMGEVWLAVQTGIGSFQKPLALKLLLPHLAERPQAVNMFLAEAQVAARMNHPNVAQVFDVGEVNGRYFIAMELVRGVSLATLIEHLASRGEVIPAPLVAHIAWALCDGLHHAHELTGADGERMGLVHRDVTPHNVLISEDGAVKLTDFGIAKARDEAPAPGRVVGKLLWLPPEQRDGKPVDRRADIFSTALTLATLATLEPVPGSDKERAELLKRARERRGDLPEAFHSALQKCLSNKPEERLSTARALKAELPSPPASAAEALGALVTRVCPAELGELQAKTVHAFTLRKGAVGTESIAAGLSAVPAPSRGKIIGVMILTGVILGVAASLVFSRPKPVVASVPPVVAVKDPAPPAPVEDAGLQNFDGVDLTVEPEHVETAKPVEKQKLQVGYLAVDARPWAEVYVGSNSIGTTPIARYPMMAGTRSVLLKNPETGKSTTRRVQIVSGKLTTLKVDLR